MLTHQPELEGGGAAGLHLSQQHLVGSTEELLRGRDGSREGHRSRPDRKVHRFRLQSDRATLCACCMCGVCKCANVCVCACT